VPVFLFGMSVTIVITTILASFILGVESSIPNAIANTAEKNLTLSTSAISYIKIVQGSSFPDNKEFYKPRAFEAGIGSTIVWINNDSVLHTVTSRDPNNKTARTFFDSGPMASGAIFQHTFNEIGTFDYWCTFHPFMTGQVIISTSDKVIEPQETTTALAIQKPSSITSKPELPPDLNTTKMQGPGFVLKLQNQKVAIDIPLEKGYENGNDIYFITTDVSDEKTAALISNKTGFKVNFAPVLSKTPELARGQAYVFKNGIEGQGLFGFQPTVTNAKPGNEGYSPLLQIHFVKWTQGSSPRELRSVQEITAAQKGSQVTIASTDIIVDHPAVKWQGGSLKIREDKVITDDSPFAGGQVTRIDTDKMIVTFVTFRGYGPDGRTLYWLVTDATPLTKDITTGGIVYVPADEKLAATPVAVDFYQFINGIEGPSPQGFQPPISLTNIADPDYSPMWRIYFVYWKDPAKARVLETLNDLSQAQQAGLIKIMPVLQGKHIVNCPFFDQETILKHKTVS
jgi:plastocyanin